jgi:hypothetical protein
MTFTERWHQLLQSIRARPVPWAIGGAVAVAAVVTGALAAAVISSGPRGVAQAASAEPTVSASVSPSEEPSPTSSATPTPTPSPSPSPSASAIATPSAVATPVPTPPSNDGIGGLSPPSWDVEGEWTALPQMPDSAEYRLSDVLVLDDGSVTVIRWSTQNDDPDVLRWDEEDSAWVRVATEPFFPGTDTQWGQGADGRLYTFESILDPATEPWQAQPFHLAPITEPYAGTGMDAGSDGRIYRPDTEASSSAVTVLDIYDPLLDDHHASAPTDVSLVGCVLRALDDRLIALDMARFAFYDPATDSWSADRMTPGDQDCYGAGYGPDSRLYTASMWWGGDIHAWDERSAKWLTVESPPVGRDFRPRFITGPDNLLWAIDPHDSYVFIPEGS